MLKKYKLQQCKLLNGKKKLSCVHLVFAWNKVCSSSFTLYTTCCKFLVTNKIIKKRIQTSFRGVIISTHTKLNLPFSPFHSKAIHLKYDFFLFYQQTWRFFGVKCKWIVDNFARKIYIFFSFIVRFDADNHSRISI